MLYYLDCEFIEDGRTIDLISIGLVSEDGREYYAISTEFNPANASDWVVENVLMGLPPMQAGPSADLFLAKCDDRWTPAMVDPASPCYHKRDEAMAQAWKPRSVIANEIKTFIGNDPSPEFWGEWSSYDWVALCQLYGPMMDLPEGWPMRCRDVVQLLEDNLGLSQDDWPATLETAGNHDALLGAHTVKARWEWCNDQRNGGERDYSKLTMAQRLGIYTPNA